MKTVILLVTAIKYIAIAYVFILSVHILATTTYCVSLKKDRCETKILGTTIILAK